MGCPRNPKIDPVSLGDRVLALGQVAGLVLALVWEWEADSRLPILGSELKPV